MKHNQLSETTAQGEGDKTLSLGITAPVQCWHCQSAEFTYDEKETSWQCKDCGTWQGYTLTKVQRT